MRSLDRSRISGDAYEIIDPKVIVYPTNPTRSLFEHSTVQMQPVVIESSRR